MRPFTAVAATLLLLCVASSGRAAGAPRQQGHGQMPALPAIAAPASACIDGSHLLSRAAYLPTDAATTRSCGHLLSTDTLLTVHRWDHT